MVDTDIREYWTMFPFAYSNQIINSKLYSLFAGKANLYLKASQIAKIFWNDEIIISNSIVKHNFKLLLKIKCALMWMFLIIPGGNFLTGTIELASQEIYRGTFISLHHLLNHN